MGEAKGGDSESAEKQKTGDEEQTKATVHNYENPSKSRCFKLIVEDRTLHINPLSLGEVSRYFETLCLGDFKEGKEGKAELKDEKWAELVEMLDVLGVDLTKERKKIDITNCIPMLALADKWNIEVLRNKCYWFIESQLPGMATNFPSTMKLLIACEAYRTPSTILRTIGGRLAAFGYLLLQRQQIGNAIDDRQLFGAIMKATKEHEDVKDCYELMHVLDNTDVVDLSDPATKCDIPGCRSRKKLEKCMHCSRILCSTHEYDICPWKAPVFETNENVELQWDIDVKVPWPEKMY